MSSPQRIVAEHLLESQIRHRSRYSENTSDFYQLKLHRLEQDFLLMQQELNGARIRLRTAEDFEIKYELLTKQNSSLLHENSKLSKELSIRKIETDKLITEVHLLSGSLEELTKVVTTKDAEIILLLERIKQFEVQAQTLAIRASRMHQGQVSTLKKANQELEGVMDEYQNTSNLKAQQLLGQIQKLNQHNANLQEQLDRQTKRHSDQLERIIRQFDSKQQQYQSKIREEQQKVQQLKEQINQQKDKDQRQRGQGGSEQEVGFMAKQVNNLTSLLRDKQEQLQFVFEQKNTNFQEWTNQRQEFKEHIRLLQEKLYQRERENELELWNLKERLAKLHAEQISQFKKNEQDLIEAMKNIKPDQLLKDKDQQITQLNEKIYSDINLHERDKDQIMKGIETLKDRIREHNSQADNQHKILTSINLNIEEERTTKQTDYENNLTFLDQQLKRANLTIEQKNLEIKKLLNELNDLKLDSQKDRKQMLLKAENQRKQLNKEIDQLQDQKQAVQQQLKSKEKQVKVKDRQLEEQAAKTAAEKKAYERLQQELHNDCKRLSDELKMAERYAREERQRNIGSVTELNNVRRQKVGDLDRQKEQFELLYKGRMDQLKDSLNLQIDKLRVERDRFQSQLIKCRLQLSESQQDLKKVSSLVAQQSKVNKEKLVQYQKKMATLNQQISLTQNLYNSFMDAKSRLKQSRSSKQN